MVFLPTLPVQQRPGFNENLIKKNL